MWDQDDVSLDLDTAGLQTSLSSRPESHTRLHKAEGHLKLEGKNGDLGPCPQFVHAQSLVGSGGKPPEADDTCENNVILNRF